MDIRYVKGDVTSPVITQSDTHYIIHVCNDVGAFGAGVAKAISERYPLVKAAYLAWYKVKDYPDSRHPFCLGNIDTIMVNRTIPLYIINMIAQHGLPAAYNPKPLNIAALQQCLYKVRASIIPVKGVLKPGATIHMPRIGCGYGGSNWDTIEPLIVENFINHNIPVYVYDYTPMSH